MTCYVPFLSSLRSAAHPQASKPIGYRVVRCVAVGLSLSWRPCLVRARAQQQAKAKVAYGSAGSAPATMRQARHSTGSILWALSPERCLGDVDPRPS